MMTIVEHQTVELPLAPPRRLMQPTRYRSLKMIADRMVWQQAWQRVETLLADGWRVDGVIVDWGARLPGALASRDAYLARVFPGWSVTYHVSGQGQGSTRVYLQRDDNERTKRAKTDDRPRRAGT